MSLFDWFFGSSPSEPFSSDPVPAVNPANGLPMLNDSIDIMGNPFGTDGCGDSHQSSDWMSTDSSLSTDACSAIDSGSCTDCGCALDSLFD